MQSQLGCRQNVTTLPLVICQIYNVYLIRWSGETICSRSESCFFCAVSFSSPHYYASQWLFVCNGLHCMQSMGFGVFFIQSGQDSATAVRVRKAQWAFKKPLVPPLWLPHRCHVESHWNNNVHARETRRRGSEISANLTFLLFFHFHVVEKTWCRNRVWQYLLFRYKMQWWQTLFVCSIFLLLNS